MGIALAPANGHGVIRKLSSAGAHEVYTGFYDDEWTSRFGESAEINRMSGFGPEANSLNFEELLEELASVQDLIEQEDLQVFCTFNSASYSAEQIDFIERRYLGALSEKHVRGIIVSCEELIAPAHRNSLTAVASTMCAIFNESIARYYRDAGMDRVILPRDLSLDEITDIMKRVPGLEYEAFLMRNGCIFSDSHCLGLHRSGCSSLCRSLRNSQRWEVPDETCSEDELAEAVSNSIAYKQVFHENTCGLCALWRLEQAGISAYKVVGRGDSIDSLCEDIALTARNTAVAQSCSTEKEYLEKMERPEEVLWLCQNEGLSCYYPEVRF